MADAVRISWSSVARWPTALDSSSPALQIEPGRAVLQGSTTRARGWVGLRGRRVQPRARGAVWLRSAATPFRRREPRRGRNPRTGDRVDVPSKRVTYFKPGKELAAQINREPARTVPRPASR